MWTTLVRIVWPLKFDIWMWIEARCAALCCFSAYRIVSAISPAPNITYTRHTHTYRKKEKFWRANERSVWVSERGGRQASAVVERVACRGRETVSRPPTVSVAEIWQHSRHNRYCGRTEWRRMSSGQLPLNVLPTITDYVPLFLPRADSWTSRFGAETHPYKCYSSARCARFKHTNVRVKCPCTVHLYVYPQMLGYTSYRYISQFFFFF